MGLNFDRRRERREQRWNRLNDRFEHVPRQLNALRLRLYRSPNGLALGVFRGIAESLGWCVFWTRVGGTVLLLMISGSLGADGFRVSLLVAGFFYLLIAVLMRGPSERPHSLAGDVPPESPMDRGDFGAGRTAMPPPLSRHSPSRPAAVPYQQVAPMPRVDFAALDQQLTSLDRRIQRMEGIVTDRHYDWDRRMEG